MALTDDLTGIRFAWTGSGTGDVVAGTAATGFRLPPAALDGELLSWEIVEFDGGGDIVARENFRATWDNASGTVQRSSGATVYPAAPVSFGGGTKVVSLVPLPFDFSARVANIAGLQALVPAAGALVFVEGYTTPGDGGGGLFRADLTGAQQTDGGLVFGATADESATQTDATRAAIDFGAGGFTLANTDIAWGTLTIDPDDAGTPIVFPDSKLHGHRFAADIALAAIVNHKTGAILDARNHIKNYLEGYAVTTATTSYKYLTNARRWVRVWDGRTIDARWFGAQDGQYAQDEICWALTTAKRVGASEVRLSGSYRYQWPIEIPDGITLGWGKLTVVDTVALRPQRDDYLLTTHPDSEAENIVSRVTESAPVISVEHNAQSWGIKHLELDGNYAANMTELNTPSLCAGAGSGIGLELVLQNTPVWVGVNYSDHGGKAIPSTQRPVIEDVHIHGYGSNCLLGYPTATANAKQLKLGNSVRNHLFYHIHGDILGLTLYGFAWGAYAKTEACRIYGFAAEDLTDVPGTVPWAGAIQLMLYEGVRRPAGGAAHTALYDRKGLEIRGASIDLDGVDTNLILGGPLFFLTGPHFLLDGCVVHGHTLNTGGVTEGIRLLGESIIGSETEFMEGWHVSHVTMRERGHRLQLFSTSQMQAQVTARDVTIIDEYGFEEAADTAGRIRSATCEVRTGGRTGSPYIDSGRTLVFENIQTHGRQNNIMRADVLAAGAPIVNVRFQDCFWDKLEGNTHFVTPTGTGLLSGLTTNEPDKVRVVMDGCKAPFFAGGSGFENTEAFLAMTELRACVSYSGLLSEVEILYTADATDASNGYMDVPSGLMWAPKTFECHGPVAWSQVEVRNTASSAALPEWVAGSTVDRTNPTLRITAAVSNGQVFKIRASMGGRGTHHLTTAVAPAGGGGVTAVGADVEVELTASTTLAAATHGPLVISGATVSRRRVMVNGAGATTVELTVPSTLDREVEIAVDLSHSSTAAIHLLPGAGVTWGDGSTTNPQAVRNNPGSIVIVKPLGDGRFKLMGDITRRIDLASNAVSNNRERVYNSLSGAQTLSPTNFQEGSVLINIGPAATYTLPSRMTGAGDDVSDSLEVVNEHATDAIALTASGPTPKGATSIPAGASAVIRWFNRSGAEYVVSRASA